MDVRKRDGTGNWKKETLYRTLWRIRFGRGCGHVRVIQTGWWWWRETVSPKWKFCHISWRFIMIRSSMLLSRRSTCVTWRDVTWGTDNAHRLVITEHRPDIQVPSLKILITFRVILVLYAQNKYSCLPLLTQIRLNANLNDSQTAGSIYRPFRVPRRLMERCWAKSIIQLFIIVVAKGLPKKAYREVISACRMVSGEYCYDIGC